MNSIEETIFNAANQLRDPEKQAAYLDLACANNPELRQRIERLLRAGAQAKQFFAHQAPALAPELVPTVEALPPSEAPGMIIGRYKLLQQIGEGGCGVVYMAEQSEPVKRRVALKLIKLGMDAKNVIARFEAERQALAMMDHPNIAKVLDAGTSESGRPYFVMELVRGMKITEYCDEAKLATRERLDLFVKVCHAIQHAHQKGIIHRDIKPSNILVTINDGVAMPKVIDFGIAKATTGQQLTDKTLFTAFEQFIGTPAYMSPEQVVLTSLDIDTRSDIYSLGVLLYELLTGKTPFDANELLAAGFDEMRRTIREKEPSRPSTRVSTLPGEELNTTAHRRGIDAPKLANVLRGDLDWIVMKALEKDRTRRYETANGFAMDIQRHLNNEPVVACPPSAVYRFQKLVRRNKLPFVFATGVAGVLVLGVIVSTWQVVRATRAEREAEKARAGEAAQRRLAEEAGERVATKARILGELREQAEKARNSEVQERVKAEQNLYGSLVREARATRLARRVGYREEVFRLIQQARALDVPNKDLTELRLEAVACLGDFVGLTPTTFTDFPTNTSIQLTRLDSTGRLAAFALSDGTILLRELPSGKVIDRLKGEHPTGSLCFSAAGDRLISVHRPDASSSQEQLASAVVHVWAHAKDGSWGEAEKLVLPGANQCLNSVGGLYVTVADLVSHSIEIFDVKTRAVTHRFECSKEMHSAPRAALSPDGQLLVAETVDPREPDAFLLDVWNLTTSESLYRIDPRLRNLVELSFSSDGKHLACLAGSGGAIYTVNRFERVAEFREHFEEIWSFAPSATVIPLPLVQQNRVRLWDLLKNEDVAVLEEPQTAYGAGFNLAGDFLLTAGKHDARLYSLNLSAEKLALSGHVSSVPGIAFSPDGTHLASVSKDRTLKVWDAMTGRLDWERGPLPGQGQFVAWSPDGRLLVTTDYESHLVWVWDAQTRTRLLELGTNAPGGTHSAQFSPNGQYLVTAGNPGSLSLPGLGVWALERRAGESREGELSAKLVKSFDGQSHSLVFEPNGQKVAYVGNVAGNFSLGLYTWTINRTTPPRLLTTNLIWSSAQCESFTPDGLRLLTLDANRWMTTLDVVTGNKVSSFPTINSKDRREWAGNQDNLSLSPDGTRFAVGTPSSLGVDLWDPKTGRLLYSLPEQSGTVYWLAWSPNSQRLAVSRSNGDIAIWNLPEIERVLAGLSLSP